MEWEVQLAGEAFDLDQLVLAMAVTDPSINSTERGYMLRYSAFESLSMHQEVRDVATDLLKAFNGIVCLLLGSRQTISVASVAKRDAEGGWDALITMHETVRFRDVLDTSVTQPDGKATHHHAADPAAQWLKLAVADPNVAKVFRLLAPPPASWATLYKVYEVIVDDMKGPACISQAAWATERAMGRFKHTANSPKTIGDLSRHGTEPTEPPAAPMPLSEARSMVLTLVHNWLRYKQQSSTENVA
ncbi:hypothetical protein [Luteimonas saliphila]|uniref:hypothetical protein n=1 Tax=Luteimonas saliphila TaxID=2804919 RepID=UPI00192D7D1C|nr:hypothetical protein [Luteimonas saliphila]